MHYGTRTAEALESQRTAAQSNKKPTKFEALDANNATTCCVLLLLAGTRLEQTLPDRRVSVLAVDDCGAMEAHGETFAAIAPTNNTTRQSKLERAGFVGSEEEAVIQAECLALRNLVARDGAIAASVEHAVLAVLGDDLGDERVLTTAAARNARAEATSDLNVRSAANEGTRVHNPATTVWRNTEREHIARQLEREGIRPGPV